MAGLCTFYSEGGHALFFSGTIPNFLASGEASEFRGENRQASPESSAPADVSASTPLFRHRSAVPAPQQLERALYHGLQHPSGFSRKLKPSSATNRGSGPSAALLDGARASASRCGEVAFREQKSRLSSPCQSRRYHINSGDAPCFVKEAGTGGIEMGTDKPGSAQGGS